MHRFDRRHPLSLSPSLFLPSNQKKSPSCKNSKIRRLRRRSPPPWLSSLTPATAAHQSSNRRCGIIAALVRRLNRPGDGVYFRHRRPSNRRHSSSHGCCLRRAVSPCCNSRRCCLHEAGSHCPSPSCSRTATAVPETTPNSPDSNPNSPAQPRKLSSLLQVMFFPTFN